MCLFGQAKALKMHPCKLRQSASVVERVEIDTPVLEVGESLGETSSEVGIGQRLFRCPKAFRKSDGSGPSHVFHLLPIWEVLRPKLALATKQQVFVLLSHPRRTEVV